jgi:hypothetical protein
VQVLSAASIATGAAWRRLAGTGRERLWTSAHGGRGIRGARNGAARVVGVDFSGSMLMHGLEKVRNSGLDARVQLVRGDATALPAAAGSVDAVTIAFGIRNVRRHKWRATSCSGCFDREGVSRSSSLACRIRDCSG